MRKEKIDNLKQEFSLKYPHIKFIGLLGGNLSEIQIKLLKAITANPSVTLRVLSSKLCITVNRLRYQHKQLESKGVFLCRKGATKKGALGISNLLNNHIMAF